MRFISRTSKIIDEIWPSGGTEEIITRFSSSGSTDQNLRQWKDLKWAGFYGYIPWWEPIAEHFCPVFRQVIDFRISSIIPDLCDNLKLSARSYLEGQSVYDLFFIHNGLVHFTVCLEPKNNEQGLWSFLETETEMSMGICLSKPNAPPGSKTATHWEVNTLSPKPKPSTQNETLC
jgi:hypothetical protein